MKILAKIRKLFTYTPAKSMDSYQNLHDELMANVSAESGKATDAQCLAIEDSLNRNKEQYEIHMKEVRRAIDAGKAFLEEAKALTDYQARKLGIKL